MVYRNFYLVLVLPGALTGMGRRTGGGKREWMAADLCLPDGSQGPRAEALRAGGRTGENERRHCGRIDGRPELRLREEAVDA